MSCRDYTINKNFKLTESQNEIIEFMLQRSKCVNAAQTGLGKTYCTCTAVMYLLSKYTDSHCVFLVPQKAVKAFKRELTEKLHISFNLITSSDYDAKNTNRITIITYTMLGKYIELISALKENNPKLILVADEAHSLSDQNSKIYTTVANIRHYFNVCWFLTATPLKNNIEGLFWLFNLLDPDIFKDWNTFKYSFCVIDRHKQSRIVGKGKNKKRANVMVEEIIGYKNLDTLRAILERHLIIKQKQYNLEFLYHKVELDEELKKPYFQAGLGLLRESAEDSFAVRIHDLQQVVDNISPDSKMEKMTNKEQLLIKLVALKMKNKQPTLIYTDYNDVVDRLEKLLNLSKKITGVRQVLKVTGSIAQKQREKVEELIDENTVVVITSAGTESINLQKANSIIFYDTPFSIKTLVQCLR